MFRSRVGEQTGRFLESRSARDKNKALVITGLRVGVEVDSGDAREV